MAVKELVINLGKLVIGGVLLFIGTMVGGIIARWLPLPAPTIPQGMDVNTVGLYMMLASPLFVLGLAPIARGLSGNVVLRAGVLSFLMWIAYTVNTQLEASIFTTYAASFWYSVISGVVSAIFCGSAVAFLFPADTSQSASAAVKAFLARHTVGGWAWRLPLAAVTFMPIYFGFGLMVVPFTADYYRQNMFGLVMPTIDQILPILFLRSVLFLVACLPILMLWQKSEWSLFWRLGFALYVLVGLVAMLIATWLPVYVRFPHALEILADEFVYAGVLVLLLGKGSVAVTRLTRIIPKKLPA